ncbi:MULTISPECIES: hypothetical protein [unclassified Phaeobacter]|uniref:hypothetical protein n=1 Tax=unclassified Phaeobacter TaxID=2621772 RepID=UPI003A84F48D
MKPGFALSLSSTGVCLLQRAAGGWRQIGTVALDVEDLGEALADLRRLGERYAQGPIACKLIIPNDQIRYLTLQTGVTDTADRRAAAERGLDGATPYRVDELAFDLSEDGSQTHVAAVARETLQEAEDFALMHGFLPVGFVAVPGDMDFLGEPYFGASQTLLQSGEEPAEPDGIAVVNIGPAAPPEPEPEPEPVESTSDGTEARPDEQPDALPTDAAAVAKDATADEAVVNTAATAPEASDTVEASAVETAPSATADTPSDPAEPAAATGFSTRRRKEGAVRSEPTLRATTAAADVASSPAGTSTDAAQPSDKPSGKVAATTPGLTANGKSPDTGRVVPHAAFGTIALADSPVGSGGGLGKAPAIVTPPAAAKAIIPPAPKPSGPAPVLPRDEMVEISLTDTPKDKKSLHEAGKAALLAGVRKKKIGGKPRFLGLALVTALLLFMAIVAAWAILAEKQTRNAVTDGTAAPLDTPETAEAGDIAPQVSAIPDQPDDGSLLPLDNISDDAAAVPSDPAESDVDGLSSTDTAVLDALRLEQEGPEAAEQTLTEDLDLAELAPEADPEMGDAEQDTPLTRAAQYAATGIWQHAPETPEAPGAENLETLYVASIDPTDISEDAIALPDPDLYATDLQLGSVSTPTAAGQQFELDERGLVKATPEGSLNPDGVMVFLGRPEKVPPPTPARPDPEVAAAAEEAARQAILSELRPKQRPRDLVEQNERAQLGGLSRAELGALRPRPRPPGLKPAEENSLPATAQAIARSVVPRARPANFANLVDRAQRNPQRNAEPSIAEAVASSPPQTVTPRIPSSASVARQATIDNAINLRRVNLIGVYGTPSNRRALILMPNGRYKKVKVGDRIDGGRVVAIGDSQLQYQKGNRNLTLKIPSG